MRSSSVLLASVLALVPLNGVLSAAALPKIDLPEDSPVDLISADYGESNETVRGGAMLLDFHAALSLRNSSQRKIRGHHAAGERAGRHARRQGIGDHHQLECRPAGDFSGAHRSALAAAAAGFFAAFRSQIGLDGVLFDDLSFYGPDKLSSRRTMTLSEWEARRDRRYFKSRAGGGRPGAATAGNA